MHIDRAAIIRVVTFGQLLISLTVASAQTKLLRFPDIHGNQVVFCHGADLWRAPAEGGKAVRVTAHPGQELFAKFSPDGKSIAFTAQYDGDEQVYVVAAEGGVPKQLTFYPARGPLAPRWGYDNQVYGWTPDGRSVLFRSLRDANGGSVETALYTVGVEGGLPLKLPMPTAGAGDFSPDAKKIVYSPLFRDFRTWKRYQGGWAQDLYIFDLLKYDVRKIAPGKRTERDPMWIGGAVYFVSDRDGTLNLYKYDPALDQVTQLTRYKQWDVRWASSDNRKRIVYELNGELHVYDVASGNDRKISIVVPHDGLSMRPSRYSAEKNIEDIELSPKGERALFVARGDVFTVPIKKGPTRNLTNSSSAHDKWARWSPDGVKIAFVSDLSGEDQVYLVDQDGSKTPEQLTTDFEGMLYAPEWSPDGRRLAFSDKEGKLYVLTVEDKSVVEVADEKRGLLRDYAWSPRGGHLAFSLRDASQFSSIHIWSVADAKLRRITGPYTDEYRPTWDPEGQYLFFLASREYAPQISSVEWNYAGNRQVGVFALALRNDVPNPFAPRSDEVTIGEKKDDKPKDEAQAAKAEDADQPAEKDDTPAAYLDIDFKGKTITVKSENGSQNCIIDCQFKGRGFDFHNGEDNNSILDGVKIINGTAGGFGGGIRCTASSPTIINCIITGNTAGEYGGGICNSYNSSPILTNCTFSENSAESKLSAYGSGGGMCNLVNCNPILTNCTFSGNFANHSGAGIYNCENSNPVLTKCTFTANTARHGGGMYNCYDSKPSLINCAFSKNLAEYGGAVKNSESIPTLINCTLYGNSAEVGGGISNGWGGSTELTNSILWDNSSSGDIGHSAQINDARGSRISVINYCCIQGWNTTLGGIGNIGADPLFVKPEGGDYHLKSAGWRWDIEHRRWHYDEITSPCIDAGNPGSPLDGELLNMPEGPSHLWGTNLRINMGRYGGTAEAGIPPHGWSLLADINNDGLVNSKDFSFQVQSWMKTESRQPGDLDRNGIVNTADLALLSEDWLKYVIRPL